MGKLLWIGLHHPVKADPVHGATVLQTDLLLQLANTFLQPGKDNTVTQRLCTTAIIQLYSNTHHRYNNVQMS